MLPRSRRSNTGNSSRRSCSESKTHQREFSVIFDASATGENTSIPDRTTDNIPHPSQGILTDCRSPNKAKPVSHDSTITSKSLEDEINQIFVTVLQLSCDNERAYE